MREKNLYNISRGKTGGHDISLNVEKYEKS